MRSVSHDRNYLTSLFAWLIMIELSWCEGFAIIDGAVFNHAKTVPMCVLVPVSWSMATVTSARGGESIPRGDGSQSKDGKSPKYATSKGIGLVVVMCYRRY